MIFWLNLKELYPSIKSYFFNQEKHNLPEAIEREAYSQHERRVSSAYRRSIRALVFALKRQPVCRQQVLAGDMQISNFVTTYKKEGKPKS